jgi:hypothetical protein
MIAGPISWKVELSYGIRELLLRAQHKTWSTIKAMDMSLVMSPNMSFIMPALPYFIWNVNDTWKGCRTVEFDRT